MTTAAENLGVYRTMLDSLLAEASSQVPGTPQWLRDLRQDAMSRFETLGFPSTRLEEWKYTDVGRVRRTRFAWPQPNGPAHTDVPFPAIETAARLVFVNGRFMSQMSSHDETGPVRFRTLSGTPGDRESELKTHFLRPVDYHDRAFVALNTALFADAAVIEVADGAQVAQPIHVVFVSCPAPDPVLISPRLSVRVGPNASVRLIESYIGQGEGLYLTNAVTEMICGENATVDQLKFQNETAEGIHIAMQHTRLDPNSTFRSTSLSIGGSLVRNELGVTLDGRGAECRLNGLYLATGKQHVDNHTFVDHAVEHTSSRELYKGILAGRSRGVFNGAVFVRQNAQKTDAAQQNRNLLLSDDAVIDTKPELQILANDVRCSHGATIGQLQVDALFYLRTRGLGLEAARRILTQAFASEVLEGLGEDSLVATCGRVVRDWITRQTETR